MKNENPKEIFKDSEFDNRDTVPTAVVRRLPRYFRYLRQLIREGRNRISSSELSKIMNVTASQIRQDLNCFGGFGQQGYGYNVNYLYAKICKILGVGSGFHAVVIGSGNLGRAIVKSTMFEKRGVEVIGMFDVSPEIVGSRIAELEVMHIDKLKEFCDNNCVDIAVLTLPKQCADEVVEKLVEYEIPAIWNFTGKEYNIQNGKTFVEEIHLGDSLMVLCFELERRRSAVGGSIEAFDDFDGKQTDK